MTFIDASVFVYAYLKPKARLPSRLNESKKSAQAIIRRLEEGEEMITSLIHISEVSNILEARFTHTQSTEVVAALLSKKNLEIEEPSVQTYLTAIEESNIQGIGINDALAILMMRRKSINEIYSYDSDFDKIPEATRITV